MDDETLNQYNIQSQLNKENAEYQNSMYASQLQEQIQQSQAVLVDQTNPKRIVREIILRLRGVEERADGTLVKVAEPKINKVGVDNIWFILDSHINQNVILSHLEARDIGNIMDAVQSDLVDDLSLNWREYGIKKKTDLDTINNSVLTNVFLALKRAEGQNEKNWIGKISVENISSSPRFNADKKGSWKDMFKL